MRRLPVYLLLDTSGSMQGEAIQALKVGVQSLIATLRQDPHALESVHLCIITFDRVARLLCPLQNLEQFQSPLIECPSSGPTMTGAALHLLCECVERDVIKNTADQKGDWRPIIFLMTDGGPSDTKLFGDIMPRVKAQNFATIIACAAGSKAKTEPLRKLTDQIVSLEQMDSSSFAGFFKWVSSTVSTGNLSMGSTQSLTLPPPPTEIQVVV